MFESVRIGDVISLLGFLVGGAVFFFGMRQKIELLGQRLGFLEKTVEKATTEQNEKIDKLSELLIRMGRYEERMLRYDDRLISMSREIEGLKNGLPPVPLVIRPAGG